MAFEPQTAELNKLTVEDRLARIESILDKVIEIARNHPMGKMLIDMLGL